MSNFNEVGRRPREDCQNIYEHQVIQRFDSPIGILTTNVGVVILHITKHYAQNGIL
jgi:hypothetical protein